MNYSLNFDFTKGSLRYRCDHLQGTNELIAKAIGFKNSPLTIFDVTAGLGREAFLLAALGNEVTLFERNSTVAQQLKNNLKKALIDPQLVSIISRMKLIEICAIAFLQNLSNNECPDIIYCDPMFPPRKKSALVKKEMQYLQKVVGEDKDADLLIEIAIQKAKRRVVVKRPPYAPSYTRPHITYKARTHCFDIFIK